MDYQHSNDVVPLVVLALEIGVTADELARQLGDSVIIDDLTGLWCVPAERSRAHLDARRAAQQAEAERRAAAREEARRRPNPTRERIKALQAAQSSPTGNPGEPLDPRQALAMMKELDGTRDQQLDAAATQRDEQTSGQIVYRPYRTQE